MRKEAQQDRERLGIPGRGGLVRVDHRKMAKMEADERTKEGLRMALRLPVTKDNEAAQEGAYNSLFAHCSKSGDWVGAFKAYREFLKRGFVPNRYVFTNLIGSCKNTEPVQVDRAILLLDQMKERDVTPTIAVYNNIIDCCRAGHAWRRGVQVFEVSSCES